MQDGPFQPHCFHSCCCKLVILPTNIIGNQNGPFFNFAFFFLLIKKRKLNFLKKLVYLEQDYDFISAGYVSWSYCHWALWTGRLKERGYKYLSSCLPHGRPRCSSWFLAPDVSGVNQQKIGFSYALSLALSLSPCLPQPIFLSLFLSFCLSNKFVL